MRTAIEREQEEVDSEITLSATTLLGIFFGLVLICGVFFGFGYSTGRHGNEGSSANAPVSSAQSSEPTPSNTPKPSAMESLKPATSTPDSNTVTESLDQDSTPAPAPVVKQTALAKAPATVPSAIAVPVAKPVTLPTPVSGGTFMVQIAAVNRSEDANALATALRQRGYSVVVRNESQDQLLHIQVGPFATRDEAKLMRSKLLSDGYNAILKP